MRKVKVYRKREKERKRGGRGFILTRKISQSAVSRLRVMPRKLRSYLSLYSQCAHELLSIGLLRGLVINTAARVKKYRKRN